MKYTCFRCENFKTNIKTHYVRHLKRKRPCPKVNDLDVGKLLDDILKNSYINRYEKIKIYENDSKMTPKMTPIDS